MENASRFYSDRVKQMIERQKAKYGWEFLFSAQTLTRWKQRGILDRSDWLSITL